jgi:gluconolactonase
MNTPLATTVMALSLATSLLGAESILAPGAKVEKLAGDFQFTEGPAADAAGNVFFTDQPNNRILKWSVDGKLTTFAQPAGRANGMCFDARGNLLACADEKTEMWLIPATAIAKGSLEGHQVLFSEYNGVRLNGPNDVWCHPDGALYFTDPFYKRPWWSWEQMPQPGQHVYRVAPDRKTITRVADSLKQPNGIVGTPDGKTLYVADIGDKKTYRFRIRPDGSLDDRTLLYELGSDGMTLDGEGNLYLTGRGVTVFDPNGARIENIPVPEGWTANVCFGGADRQTLFITASKGLYAVKTRVKGAFKQGK